jgi:hypothetical protein
MFADDSTIHAADEDIQTVNEQLQEGMKTVIEWTKCNNMVLNPTKTKSMLLATRQKHQLHPGPLTVHANDTVIEEVCEHELLGIQLDNKFSWQSHIDNLCKRISNKLYLLFKLSQLIDEPSLKMFFHAHIQPLFDYASVVWDGAAAVHLDKLNSLHKRGIKLLLPFSNLPVQTKMQQLKILPLEKKLYFNKCVLMYKILENKSPSYMSSMLEKAHIGSKAPLRTPRPRLDLFKTSFRYAGPKAWNDIPDHIRKSKSLDKFKNSLHSFLSCQK